MEDPMKNTALKTAGTIFLVVSLLQLSRVILRFHVYFESYELPVMINGIAFVVMLALSFWMFLAARQK